MSKVDVSGCGVLTFNWSNRRHVYVPAEGSRVFPLFGMNSHVAATNVIKAWTRSAHVMVYTWMWCSGNRFQVQVSRRTGKSKRVHHSFEVVGKNNKGMQLQMNLHETTRESNLWANRRIFRVQANCVQRSRSVKTSGAEHCQPHLGRAGCFRIIILARSLVTQWNSGGEGGALFAHRR